MDKILGKADQLIENLNLIKILATWVKKVHFLEGDSRECLVGDEWWFWILLVQGEPKKESFTILSPCEKTF